MQRDCRLSSKQVTKYNIGSPLSKEERETTQSAKTPSPDGIDLGSRLQRMGDIEIKLQERAPFLDQHYETERPYHGGGDEHEITHSPFSQRAKVLWRLLSLVVSFLFGLLTMSLLATSFSLSPSPWTRENGVTESNTDMATGLPADWMNGHCGPSVTDATSRGCRFSAVLHAWLPPDCITQGDTRDDIDMYMSANWRWYMDNETEVSHEVVGRGELPYIWTSFGWHVTHCAYVWKRLHRSVMEGRSKVDAYTASFGHTEHCVYLVSERATLADQKIKVFTKFPKCT